MQPPTQPPSLFWALLEPLVPRVLVILFVNVGVIMPGSGRKVFSEPPGLLPLRTASPGPQTLVFLRRVRPSFWMLSKGDLWLYKPQEVRLACL